MPYQIKTVAIKRGNSATPMVGVAVFRVREDAKKGIGTHLKKFERSGYNEEHDYWWARDNADVFEVRHFFIEAH